MGWYAISAAGGGGGNEGGGGGDGAQGGGELGGARGGGGDGEGGDTGGGEGRTRIEQSVQSVPSGQASYSAPAPPSSHTPSLTHPCSGQLSVQTRGGDGGGGGTGGGVVGSGGGEGGCGGDGGIDGVGGGARGAVVRWHWKPMGYTRYASRILRDWLEGAMYSSAPVPAPVIASMQGLNERIWHRRRL